jgi:hypothetical protein
MSNVNNILDTRVSSVNLFGVLSQIYGAKGIPFPNPPKQGNPSMIAEGFGTIEMPSDTKVGSDGDVIRRYTDEVLGNYEFLPTTINGIEIPNAIVLITGEKKIIEEDVVDVGTVFEKAFVRPYDITIISTLYGYDGQWPEADYKRMARLYKENDLVTLKCASTNIFLEPENNFLIQRIEVLDSRGSENVEVIQFTGRSNKSFELEIL